MILVYAIITGIWKEEYTSGSKILFSVETFNGDCLKAVLIGKIRPELTINKVKYFAKTIGFVLLITPLYER